MQVLGGSTISKINKILKTKNMLPNTYENSIKMGIALLDEYTKDANDAFSLPHLLYGINNPDELALLYYNQGPNAIERKVKANNPKEQSLFSKKYARITEGLMQAYKVFQSEYMQKQKEKISATIS